jgi:hypothetical protein
MNTAFTEIDALNGEFGISEQIGKVGLKPLPLAHGDFRRPECGEFDHKARVWCELLFRDRPSGPIAEHRHGGYLGCWRLDTDSSSLALRAGRAPEGIEQALARYSIGRQAMVALVSHNRGASARAHHAVEPADFEPSIPEMTLNHDNQVSIRQVSIRLDESYIWRRRRNVPGGIGLGRP